MRERSLHFAAGMLVGLALGGSLYAVDALHWQEVALQQQTIADGYRALVGRYRGIMASDSAAIARAQSSVDSTLAMLRRSR